MTLWLIFYKSEIMTCDTFLTQGGLRKMAKLDTTGVYQLPNGNWAFRYAIVIDNKRVERKRNKDEQGNPYKTVTSAVKARRMMIEKERNAQQQEKVCVRKTVAEVFEEYCLYGRTGKAYGTIRKQDSLWRNHIKEKYGNRYVDDITSAEVNDYLTELYYVEARAYGYVESFLKLFYLIFGQSYSRNYLSAETYHKLCKNKDIRIHMPNRKIDDDDDITVFSDDEMEKLSEYFKGTNGETAFLLGKYCGLRINECYGIKWNNIDLEKGVIKLERQMQYQDGVIRLVALKTRNAKRTIAMAQPLWNYFIALRKHIDEVSTELSEIREQKQTFVVDMVTNETVSSLELVNSLDNGKIQTVNSMKYHTRQIMVLYGITFRYHYLRHTYGTRLAIMNTPMHILCKQMGHSSSKVTQKYYLGNSDEGVEVLRANLDKIK